MCLPGAPSLLLADILWSSVCSSQFTLLFLSVAKNKNKTVGRFKAPLIFPFSHSIIAFFIYIYIYKTPKCITYFITQFWIPKFFLKFEGLLRSKLKNLKNKDQEEREAHIQGLKLIKIKDKFKEIESLKFN